MRLCQVQFCWVGNVLLRQRLAKCAAGLQRRVVWSLRADHTLTHEIQPRAVAVTLPAAHPLAVAPAVGAAQRHALPMAGQPKAMAS